MEAKNTHLHNEHNKLNAQMAPFAGWNMPIHYGSILGETKHTRTDVSIFDISHMGELFIKENPDNSSLDKIITSPVVKMKPNSCRYGFLLNESGTIIDDLIVYRIKKDEWMIVVNAANEKRDADIINSKLSSDAEFENKSNQIVKIDIQGPKSLNVLKKIAGNNILKLSYFNFDSFNLLEGEYIISRTGYTGELGFEVYIDHGKGAELWQELLKHENVRPAGLGARDVLRLEMGYPLYGHELTEKMTPLEGGMSRFLDMGKEFFGRDAISKKKEAGLKKKLTGFIIYGRRTPRQGNRIVADNKDAGFVTSGVFSPHLNKGLGMGYIDIKCEKEGKIIYINTGKGEIKAQIKKRPFINNTSLKNIE